MKRRNAFTLIEILIVVIILGILAAIVIPQFGTASNDAKQSSVVSTVQSVRSQLELYNLNHGSSYPNLNGAAPQGWAALTQMSTFGGITYGPYMQSVPANPFNQSTVVLTATGGTTTGGWAQVSTNNTFQFFGLGQGGTWYPIQ
jgi:general secretion pathway protein G